MTRPITPEDLWRLRRIGQPEPLPGGGAAVVPVTSYDVEENRGSTRLFLVDAGGEARALTREESDSTQPAVDPAGRRVAFVRKDDPEAPAQLFVMPLDGGEARRLTDLPLGVTGPRWLPDGSAILVWSPLYRDHLDVESTREHRGGLKERKVSARTTEDRVYRYWDRWLTDGEVPHLFRVDAETGEASDLMPGWTRMIDFDEIGAVLDVAPDGTEVAFSAAAVEPSDPDIRFAVYRMPLGGEPAAVDPGGPPNQFRPRYSPDGTAIVYGVQVDWPGFYADRTRLIRHDLGPGSGRELAPGWDRSPSGWEFTPDGSHLVFSAEDDARMPLFTLDAAGGEPEVLAPGGWLHGPRPVEGGRVWCRSESLRHPADPAVVGPDGTIERIGGFNDEVLSELELGEVEDVRFTGAGGAEVQMWLIYPPGYREGEKRPLIHDIHGGPHGVTGDSWHYRWNGQVFAAGGAIVAAVNFHGSSSWGDEFARCIQGAWGDKPAADVMAATHHLISHGLVDTERMAIAGGSYGGYLVSWLIGQTDQFAAAVCHAGVTNLLGQYATDITHGRAQSFGGEPWDGIENIRRWSPTDHTAGMHTPTLVIHGEKDYRVVVTQGLELYGLLKARGVDARLVYYPDEGHWILKPQNSLHWYGEVLGWMERYIGTGTPEG